MAAQRPQIPLGTAITDKDGRVTLPWSYWFTNLADPVGNGPVLSFNTRSGNVILTQRDVVTALGPTVILDGSGMTVGQTTLYHDTLSHRRTIPQSQDIFVSKSDGNIYSANGSTWQLQSGALTGDVTKPAFSDTLTLVNTSVVPGIYTNATVTVDEKGRITSATTGSGGDGSSSPAMQAFAAANG